MGDQNGTLGPEGSRLLKERDDAWGTDDPPNESLSHPGGSEPTRTTTSHNGDVNVPNVLRHRSVVEAPSPAANSPEFVDDRQCRICLAGPEEELELGRLIRPCKCKGSISFVHVECLNKWRTLSESKSAFWQCPQCHYKYAFARTKVLGLATSRAAIGSITFVLFTILVFISSSIVIYFNPDLAPTHLKAYIPPDEQIVITKPYEWWSYDFSYTALPGTIKDMVKLAIATFADVDVDNIIPPVKYEGKTAAKVASGGGFKQTVRMKKQRPPTTPGLIKRLIARFILGLSALGIISFLQLLISMSLLAPLQVIRNTWLRRRRGEGAAEGLGVVVIVVFVLIGAARAVMQVYKLTNTLAKMILSRAELAILDVEGKAHLPHSLAREHDDASLWEKVKREAIKWVADTAHAWDPRRWREWGWVNRRRVWEI